MIEVLTSVEFLLGLVTGVAFDQTARQLAKDRITNPNEQN